MHHKVSDEGKRACRVAITSAMDQLEVPRTDGMAQVQILTVAMRVFAEFHGRDANENDVEVLKRALQEYGKGNLVAEGIMKKMGWL